MILPTKAPTPAVTAIASAPQKAARIVPAATFAPPVLLTRAHPVVAGWVDRVIGWVDTKLETLSRYAADPSSGGGLQTFNYFMLQLLNREINVLKHLRTHLNYLRASTRSPRCSPATSLS